MIGALDVVLQQWFNISTLLGPPAAVVSMCQPLSGIAPETEACTFLRVEAFGSGAVIVPRFDFDVSTTQIGQLFSCVWAYYAKEGIDRQSCFLRLICGEDDVLSLEEETQLLSDVFELQRHRIVSAVCQQAVDPVQCLLPLAQTNGRQWRRTGRRRFRGRSEKSSTVWRRVTCLSRWIGLQLKDRNGKQIPRPSIYNDEDPDETGATVVRLELTAWNVKGTYVRT